MKAAGYCRVSTENQNGADTFGLEAQREAIRHYCQANGLELLRVYEDPALSGSLQPLERPGLGQEFLGLHAHQNDPYSTSNFWLIENSEIGLDRYEPSIVL